MSATLQFEGRPLPAVDELADHLIASDRGERAWLVRAAVVHGPLAGALTSVARAMLADPRPRARAAAIEVAEALLLRSLVGPLAAELRADPGRADARWLGVPDPLAPERSLARAAFEFVLLAAPRGRADVQGLIRWAMAVPELRVPAWHALGNEAPEAVLPHLGALLIEAPELAEAVATRFALVHTEHCHDAARAVAPLPEATRRAFADALSKHLKRIFSVRRWAECRRILFGR